jgi:dolichyl-phosphate-mannose--protein O-mannosyl transferase
MLASVMSSFKYAMLVFFPFAPIVYGLIIAPGAFAYRALVPSATDAAATFD